MVLCWHPWWQMSRLKMTPVTEVIERSKVWKISVTLSYPRGLQLVGKYSRWVTSCHHLGHLLGDRYMFKQYIGESHLEFGFNLVENCDIYDDIQVQYEKKDLLPR